ncbi:MAG: hypothetical protein KDD22_03090 [Bdellovibrionales bacterium]|nr:hypothetical protein [Bdellovibrionales bacterium]
MFWIGIHLIGLMMILNGTASPRNFIYSIIHSLWIVEAWGVCAIAFCIAGFAILNLLFRADKKEVSSRKQHSLLEPQKHQDFIAKPQLIPPDPEITKDQPQEPKIFPENLKNKAILQILGKEECVGKGTIPRP